MTDISITLDSKCETLRKLLLGVRDKHSLRAACNGVCSYSFAWKLVTRFELQHNVKVINRNLGSVGSTITPSGLRVLEQLQTCCDYLKAQNEALDHIKSN